MTKDRILELLKIEQECILRASRDDCDRCCDKCDLVQDDDELKEMYNDVIYILASSGEKRKVEFIESYIKYGAGDYQWNDNHGELIRCKDCIHYTEMPGKWECDLYEWVHEGDWFCADGEREENAHCKGH